MRDHSGARELNTMRYAHRYSPLVGGSFAANGVACGHASSRLETIVEPDRRLIAWRFGESSGGYDGESCDDSNDRRAREKSGQFGSVCIVSGVVQIDSLYLKNVRKDAKLGGFRLRESSGKIGRARIVSGIVAIDSSHLKTYGKTTNTASGEFGKDREGSDRFGDTRNRFPAPENILKDTKHGVSSLRESSGKIGIG
ncbi:hypothetical protein NQ317_019130 [Molorchus minor]|uniref:Uncharacterized protein n=1 Tax=Molorchus minor TaxID=1323400 RepID=A0ABQ9JJ57_9CUCU|nr:hypothetical protein NQ317_019130 [Molorchus minor]